MAGESLCSQTGRCASHLLVVPSKELRLSHLRVGSVPQRTLGQFIRTQFWWPQGLPHLLPETRQETADHGTGRIACRREGRVGNIRALCQWRTKQERTHRKPSKCYNRAFTFYTHILSWLLILDQKLSMVRNWAVPRNQQSQESALQVQ